MAAQTAEELVAKNVEAKGGADKIRSIKTLRMTGTLRQGDFVAQLAQDAKAPDFLRQSVTIQGMTAVEAFDGKTGWQIQPFGGRKDPELMGDGEDLRDLVELDDFYVPLFDYQEKGNKVEFLGHDTVDGDDAYRLRVTLKNGDLVYYDLDPTTYLEIRADKQQFIRGAVRETVTDIGSYKQVAGVYFPFSIEIGPKRDPSNRTKVSIDKIEANVPIEDAEFRMPAPPAVPSPQKHEEPPKTTKEPPKPPKPAVPKG
jgi:hypothetical protein